jgi:hypothetical protein
MLLRLIWMQKAFTQCLSLLSSSFFFFSLLLLLFSHIFLSVSAYTFFSCFQVSSSPFSIQLLGPTNQILLYCNVRRLSCSLQVLALSQAIWQVCDLCCTAFLGIFFVVVQLSLRPDSGALNCNCSCRMTLVSSLSSLVGHIATQPCRTVLTISAFNVRKTPVLSPSNTPTWCAPLIMATVLHGGLVLLPSQSLSWVLAHCLSVSSAVFRSQTFYYYWFFFFLFFFLCLCLSCWPHLHLTVPLFLLKIVCCHSSLPPLSSMS